MSFDEKAIRARESATAYVRGTSDKDRTALIALLDKERAKSAAMLAALKRLRNCPDLGLESLEPETCDALDEANAAIDSAEGR